MSEDDLERLAHWRSIGARHSQVVIDLASRVLKSRGLGDQEWSIREQLAIALLDLGRINASKEQVEILKKKFPKSPRRAILDGLICEADGQWDGARKVYEALLAKDETHIVRRVLFPLPRPRWFRVFQGAHQRLITLSQTHSPTTTIPLLIRYLDTFYTDPSGWSLLAELYADLGLYDQSLAALGHVLLISPWDSGAVCRAGETAYTMGDYQLALKHFLRAVEMQTAPPGTSSGGPEKTRAWWGVKLATRRLLDPKPGSTSSVPAELATSPSQLAALDALALEKLLDAGGPALPLRRRALGGAGASAVK